jgi:hypothetical protein
MPVERIPLVGSFNQRGIDGSYELSISEDQRFLNCLFNVIQNPVTGKATLQLEKRPGWGVDSLVSAGNASTGFIRPSGIPTAISAFGDTNSTIYLGTTSVGTITGRAVHFMETVASSITYVMIKSSDGTGWFFAEDANNQLTYVGDTHTNTTIDNIASTAGMYVGQAISGTNIAADTRIATVSPTSITTTIATTGTTAGITITKTPIAKIIDADFVTTGSFISGFVELDGYLFYCIDTGNIYNSDLNSVTSYPSTGVLPVQNAPDPAVAIARHKNMIIVFGSASKEAFYNAGNASGSPLQRAIQYFERIGCLDQRSITTLENDVYFVSTPYEGDVGVYRIRDMAAQKVSTPNVDTVIGTYSANNGAIYASSFKLGGRPILALFLSTASETTDMLLLESSDNILLENGDDVLMEGSASAAASYQRTMIYHADINLWSEWQCDTATFIDSFGSGIANQILATSRVLTGGYVYRINPTSDGILYRDNGASYTMEVRTSGVDLGTSKRKFIRSVKLICDEQSSGTASISYSDDDYATWSTARDIDLTKKNYTLWRMGSHVGKRAWKISHSSNAPFRAEALEIDYTVGQ